jgi:4-aminobutyrate aminotransferase-like enzyme
MTADAGLPAVAPESAADVARAEPERASSRDAALRERARRVIPGGMYGHQSAATWPAPFPQFLERGRGCRVWDVDGREYVDFVCSFGPIVLGHAHPTTSRAVRSRRQPRRSSASESCGSSLTSTRPSAPRWPLLG